MSSIIKKLRLVKRWIFPFTNNNSAVSAAAAVGRVFLLKFQVESDCYIDGLSYTVGTTSSGNVRAGICGPIISMTTAADSPVLVESTSVPQASANAEQTIPFASTFVKAGIYYAVIQFDSATATFVRNSNTNLPVSWTQFYDRSGGYGAFTNPTPTSTDSSSNIPVVRLRVVYP